MTLRFKYQAKERESSKSPLIPVILEKEVGIFALLDSGADISVVPRHIAELAGISCHGESSQALGIGGSVNTVPAKARIRLAKNEEFYEFSLPVKIVENRDLPMLLGRHGFFSEFAITFFERKQKVLLSKA